METGDGEHVGVWVHGNRTERVRVGHDARRGGRHGFRVLGSRDGESSRDDVEGAQVRASGDRARSRARVGWVHSRSAVFVVAASGFGVSLGAKRDDRHGVRVGDGYGVVFARVSAWTRGDDASGFGVGAVDVGVGCRDVE